MAPLSLSLLLLPLAVSGATIPLSQRAPKKYGLKEATVSAFQDASPDHVVDSYLSLSKAENMTSRSSIFLDKVRRVNNPHLYARDDQLLPRQNEQLSLGLGGSEYLVDITFGGQDVTVILDTGSSDTWLIQSGFQCTDSSGNSVDESQCQFGPVYNGGFTSQISDENFKISYGDGEFVTGNMGYQDVTIAGITVPNQEVREPITCCRVQ